MFCLYILKSKNFGTYYIGISGDIKKRLKMHNSGMVKSTKSKKPWLLIHKEKFSTLRQARKRELYLKSLKKRKEIDKTFLKFVYKPRILDKFHGPIA
ncbi:GIY-YIG nuclease family protein [Patescibacteria group bacterium]|nr:GIY-YIG nuclease family protein [Patescibacteria group bacterium]